MEGDAEWFGASGMAYAHPVRGLGPGGAKGPGGQLLMVFRPVGDEPSIYR